MTSGGEGPIREGPSLPIPGCRPGATAFTVRSLEALTIDLCINLPPRHSFASPPMRRLHHADLLHHGSSSASAVPSIVACITVIVSGGPIAWIAASSFGEGGETPEPGASTSYLHARRLRYPWLVNQR